MKEEIEKLNETLRETDRVETVALIEFAEVLNHWRVHKGISLRKLGTKIGFSAAYLSDVERNNRRPSQDLLNKLKTYES